MRLVLVGAANPETRRVVLAVQQVQPDLEFVGFLDNDPAKKGSTFVGYPVLGGFEILDDLVREDVYFVNLITGSTRIRYETSRLMAAKGCRFTNLIHPSVDLSMTSVGVGNYIQEGVIIQAHARIGNNSSIHIASLVAHEVTIGDSVFIAHACSISGSVHIGDGVTMGTNSTIIPRLKVGKWATIGAGAVVIRDVPDYATVVGNPAKVIKIAEPVHANGDIFAATP